MSKPTEPSTRFKRFEDPNKPLFKDGVYSPANDSFDAVNSFVHHPDVAWDDLVGALLGIAKRKEEGK